MKIKTNDQVKILSGKDRGKTGKVMQVFADQQRIVVEGMNIMKKHLRSQKKGEPGRILELAAPLKASKVMLVCPKCNRSIRIAYAMDGDVKKRVCRKCKEFIV